MKIWVRRSDSSEESAIGIDRSALQPSSSSSSSPSSSSEPDVSDLLIKCCEVVFVGQCLPSELFLSLGSSNPLKPISNRKSVTDLLALAQSEENSDKREESSKAFVICPRPGSEGRFSTTSNGSVNRSITTGDELSPIKKINSSSTTAITTTTTTTARVKPERKSFLPDSARRTNIVRSTSASSTGSATAAKNKLPSSSSNGKTGVADRYNSPTALQNIPKTNRLVSSSPTSKKKAAPKPAWVERLNAGKNAGASPRRTRSSTVDGSPSENGTSRNLPPLHQPSPNKQHQQSGTTTNGKSSPSSRKASPSSHVDPKPLWGYSHLLSAKKSPAHPPHPPPSPSPVVAAAQGAQRTGRSVTPLNNRSNKSSASRKRSDGGVPLSASSIRSRAEVEAELDKSTQKVAAHEKAQARSSHLQRRASADRSHHSFTHQKHSLRENKSLVEKREKLEEQTREEMLQRQRDDPHFAQGIKDSRTVRSGSNSKQHSRSVSQTPEDRNNQQQQQEQQQNDGGGVDGTKTYHHVVCDKFIPTWGLPRVCNRCKGQRRDHPDAASVAAASLKNRSLTLMQKRNLINNNNNALVAASTRKPASAFQTNGRIHAKTHTDPMENILLLQQQQQAHHLNINNISSSSTNNNDHNINNTSAVIAVTPQQQIYSTRMNLSNASSTANNHEGYHDTSSAAANNENDDERQKSVLKADTVTSNSTTTTRSSSLGSTHEEGNHVMNRDVKDKNLDSKEADDDHRELAEAAKKSSTTAAPSTASLMMLSGGSGGGVLGNFARVSTALQEGQEDDDAVRNSNREGGGKVSKNESVMSDSSPEQYEVDEDVVLSENEEEQEKQRVKEKNLAHYAEF